MRHQHLDELVLAPLEESVFLLSELSHDLSQEVESVDLVLSVCIHAGHNLDDLLERVLLGQQLEECVVFAEFSENLARIERHVHVCCVLR